MTIHQLYSCEIIGNLGATIAGQMKLIRAENAFQCPGKKASNEGDVGAEESNGANLQAE